MIRQDIDKRYRRIHHLPLVHGIHDPQTRRRAHQRLALGQDRQLQRRELSLLAATLLHRPVRVSPSADDIVRSPRERVEALDEDVGQAQQAGRARLLGGVVLVELAQDLGGDDFAEGGSRAADALVFGGGLLFEELDAVGEEAVY